MTLRDGIAGLLTSLLLTSSIFAWGGQSPLIEQTIYLKHTKMCLHGDDCDGNLLRLIKLLLSNRGSVEVASREMRLTVTDEKPRLAKIVKVVRCYDKSKLPRDERWKKCV